MLRRLGIGLSFALVGAVLPAAAAEARFPPTAVYADNGTYTVTVTLRHGRAPRKANRVRVQASGLLLGNRPGERARLELIRACQSRAPGVVLLGWDLDYDGDPVKRKVLQWLLTGNTDLRLSAFHDGRWRSAGCLDLEPPGTDDAGFAGPLVPRGAGSAHGLALFGSPPEGSSRGDTGTHEVGHWMGIVGVSQDADFQVASGPSCGERATQIYNNVPTAVSADGTTTPDIRDVDLDGNRAFGLASGSDFRVCGTMRPFSRVVSRKVDWATFPSS